jgi:hypothetical protein
MGSGRGRAARVCVIALCALALAATAATGASQSADTALARAGTFVASDFPAGFQVRAGSSSSASDTVRLARGVAGCGSYTSLLKTSMSLPQAKSPRIGDATRSVSNDVYVYSSDRAAAGALTLYAKPTVVGCIENLAEKQLRHDPELRDSLGDVAAQLQRQDIAGLGDDSVVYEGDVILENTDGSKQQIGIGSAAIRVGRAVTVATYNTTGGDLTEILTPAIDASVTRLRTALARSA